MDEIVIDAKSQINSIVFIFHGYGSNKQDLYTIGKKFSEVMEDANIHLMNGIEKCDNGFGYQWFPLEGDDVAVWTQAFEKNSSKIMSYIDAVISEKKLDYDNVILAGFSQGAMLSLGIGLKYGVKAVVAFSGLLLNLGISSAHRNTKVLLTHGAKDDVIPISAMNLTKETLIRENITVKTATSPNLSHGIDDYLLSEAIDFLKKL